MPLKTKRWNEPPDDNDGYRLLVCRLRPRGVAKAREPWDAWWPELGPSRALLDEFHGKGPRTTPLPWPDYRKRYLAEMGKPGALWRIFGTSRAGWRQAKRSTLLCSSACLDPARCHRTVLAKLLSPPAAGDP